MRHLIFILILLAAIEQTYAAKHSVLWEVPGCRGTISYEISPDNTLFATVHSGIIKIWDTETLENKTEFFPDSASDYLPPVCKFRPYNQGLLMCRSGKYGKDHDARQYSILNGDFIRMDIPDDADIYSMVYSDDSRNIFGVYDDGEYPGFYTWNADDGSLKDKYKIDISPLDSAFDNAPGAVYSFSPLMRNPARDFIIAGIYVEYPFGQEKYVIAQVDPSTGRILKFRDYTSDDNRDLLEQIFKLWFNADYQENLHTLVIKGNQEVLVFDCNNLEVINIFPMTNIGAKKTAVSPVTLTMIANEYDSTGYKITEYSLESGKETKVIYKNWIYGSMEQLKYIYRQGTLCILLRDKSLSLLNAKTGNLIYESQALADLPYLYYPAYGNDIYVSTRGNVRYLNKNTGKFGSGMDNIIWFKLLSDGTDMFYSELNSDTMKIMDLSNGRIIRQFTAGDFLYYAGINNFAGISDDMRYIRFRDTAEYYMLYDFDSGELVRKVKVPPGQWSYLGYLSPEGNFFFSQNAIYNVQKDEIYDKSDLPYMIKDNISDKITPLGFANNDRYLLAMYNDYKVDYQLALINTAMWTVYRTFKNGYASMDVRNYDISPGFEYLAAVNSDKTLRIWNIPTGLEVDEINDYHAAPENVWFDPKGRNIAVTYGDGTLIYYTTDYLPQDVSGRATESYTSNAFPNPAGDFVNIVYTTKRNCNAIIRISDISGKIIAETRIHGLQPGKHNEKIDLSQTETGSYYYIITAGTDIVRGKFNVIK